MRENRKIDSFCTWKANDTGIFFLLRSLFLVWFYIRNKKVNKSIRLWCIFSCWFTFWRRKNKTVNWIWRCGQTNSRSVSTICPFETTTNGLILMIQSANRRKHDLLAFEYGRLPRALLELLAWKCQFEIDRLQKHLVQIESTSSWIPYRELAKSIVFRMNVWAEVSQFK